MVEANWQISIFSRTLNCTFDQRTLSDSFKLVASYLNVLKDVDDAVSVVVVGAVLRENLYRLLDRCRRFISRLTVETR